jgi:pantetheine-phosphate adenylyltransferase
LKLAIYPGSFDPLPLGHMNIIKRASSIFDRLIICVFVNSGKNPLFSAAERVDMIRRAVSGIPNVEVEHSSELIAEYAMGKGDCVLIKGIRTMTDFEKECQMATVNKKINPALETMFLPSDPEFVYLSSSVVREMARYGRDLREFVPEVIIPDIAARIKNGG